MGVLIKGMEMPKSGTYEVSIDNTNGKDKTIMSMFVRGSGGLICCGVYEIVPVPPHGDLVDLKAPFKAQYYDEMTEEWLEKMVTVEDALYGCMVDEMPPTIIQASEEGE